MYAVYASGHILSVINVCCFRIKNLKVKEENNIQISKECPNLPIKCTFCIACFAHYCCTIKTGKTYIFILGLNLRTHYLQFMRTFYINTLPVFQSPNISSKLFSLCNLYFHTQKAEKMVYVKIHRLWCSFPGTFTFLLAVNL